MRLITLWRPGEEEVALITDLLDEALYPVADLLAAYLAGWQIEMFHPHYPSSASLYHGRRAA